MVAAGRYLKELGATTVGALGISLGGSVGARRLPPRGRRRGARRRHPRDLAARRRRGDGEAALPRGAAARTPPTCSTTASGRCSPRGSAQAGWPGDRGLRRPDRAGLGALLRGRRRRSSGGGPRPRTHRRRAGPGARPAPEDDQIIPVEHAQDARRGGGGQRPGARLDPARRRPRRDRRGRRAWTYAVYRGFFERWAGTERGTSAAMTRADRSRQAGLLRREVTEVDNDIVRRLLWTGLLAATGALASVAANRVAAVIWSGVFEEDPPE